MTDPGMKCTRCRQPAQHRFPQHNARFCHSCLEIYFQRQVQKAIDKFAMLEPGQPVLVAVSGGKDSLSLWQVLCDLGYQTEGLHLGLDLGPFSQASLEASQEMARRLDRPLHLASLDQLAGCSVQQVVWANRRQFCSICGTIKRHYLNRLTAELGFQTLATGHNLDDEAGRLLGNMLHGHTEHLARQWPVLEGTSGGFARKIKPLCRLGGSQIKAYAQMRDLPVAQGKCPRGKGATLTFYQEAMALLDQRMPGTKQDFYLRFLRSKGAPPPPSAVESRCVKCGAPTLVETCTVCRMLERTGQWIEEKALERQRDQEALALAEIQAAE